MVARGRPDSNVLGPCGNLGALRCRTRGARLRSHPWAAGPGPRSARRRRDSSSRRWTPRAQAIARDRERRRGRGPATRAEPQQDMRAAPSGCPRVSNSRSWRCGISSAGVGERRLFTTTNTRRRRRRRRGPALDAPVPALLPKASCDRPHRAYRGLLLRTC